MSQEDIRLYFGEAIALYFKFLDFYTVKLLFPLAVIGVLQMLLSSLETLPFFCVCNVIAVTVFLEVKGGLVDSTLIRYLFVDFHCTSTVSKSIRYDFDIVSTLNLSRLFKNNGVFLFFKFFSECL